MQAELHGVLAGVTAARHEQQEEQRKIAQLKHQHEDTLQVPLLDFSHPSASSSLFTTFCLFLTLPNLMLSCVCSLGWSCIVLVSSLTSALAD